MVVYRKLTLGAHGAAAHQQDWTPSPAADTVGHCQRLRLPPCHNAGVVDQVPCAGIIDGVHHTVITPHYLHSVVPGKGICHGRHRYGGDEVPHSIACVPSLACSPPPLCVYELPVEVGNLHVVMVHHRYASHTAGGQEQEEGVPDAARPDNQDRR